MSVDPDFMRFQDDNETGEETAEDKDRQAQHRKSGLNNQKLMQHLLGRLRSTGLSIQNSFI